MNSKSKGYILVKKEVALQIFNSCEFSLEKQYDKLFIMQGNKKLSQISFINVQTFDNLGQKDSKINVLDMQTQGENVLLEIELMYNNFYNEHQGQTIETTFTSLSCWRESFNENLMITLEDDTRSFKHAKKIVLKTKKDKRTIASNLLNNSLFLQEKINELSNKNPFLSFKNVRLLNVVDDAIREGIINVTVAFEMN